MNENSESEEDASGEEEANEEDDDWICVNDFKNKKACMEFMKKDGDWVTRKKPIKQRNGDRANWFCNAVKTRGAQCAKRFFTLHNMPKELASTYRLFQLAKEHNHNELNNKKSAMTDSVKAVIRKAVDSDLTLKYIMPELRSIPCIKSNMPHKNQVKNFIKEYRKQAFGDPQVSIEDMIKFCEENKNVPDDIDETYVIAYEHSPLAEQNDENEDQVNWFRYIVTTKRLLRNASSSNLIHTDATLKIVVQRFPLLVFGTTDKTPDQKFHLIAIMITKTETADDFAFGFKSIRSAMLFIANVNYAPRYCMADAADAIGNAFHRVFGDDGTVLMCESHMKRAVDRRTFGNQNNREPIKTDLDKLKLAYNEQVFRDGCELFLQKWHPIEPEIADYIEEYWFERHENWYNGAGVRTPTTNNALEAFNGVFKQYHTKRKIRNLSEFKYKLMNIVHIESCEFDNDSRPPFTNEVTISNNAMKGGLAYSEIKHIMHRVEDGYDIAYMRHGDLKETFTFQDIDAFYAEKFMLFDVWALGIFRYYKITMDRNPENWVDSKCTCPAFSKRYICKHVICIAYY